MSTFSIATVMNGPQRELSVRGEVDLSVAHELTDIAVRHLLETNIQCLVIDLAGVTFIDSTGLAALVKVQNASKKVGKEIALRNVPHRVERVLALTGLLTAFTIQPPATSRTSAVDTRAMH